MFRQLRIWVWILWAAALVAAIASARADAQETLDVAPVGPRATTLKSATPPSNQASPSSSLSKKNAAPGARGTRSPMTGSASSSKNTAALALQSRMRRLQPALAAAGASRLALALQRVPPAHAARLISIAMQESSLIPQHTWYPDGTADLGVFQLNSKTVRHYGCNVEALLLHDPDESVRCAALVLRDKRATCLGWGVPDDEATACYHSFTPRHRLKYLKALRRWT